jgi:hypothetical protein
MKQPAKVRSTISTTEAGIVTEVKFWQPKKAPSPITRTESGIITDFMLQN